MYVVIRFNCFIIVSSMFFFVVALLSSFFSHSFTTFDELAKASR